MQARMLGDGAPRSLLSPVVPWNASTLLPPNVPHMETMARERTMKKAALNKLKRLAAYLYATEEPMKVRYASERALYRAMKADWSSVPKGVQRLILEKLGEKEGVDNG